MKKAIYLMAMTVLLFGLLSGLCNGCDGAESNITFSVHYENGTVLNITNCSQGFNELNNSTMTFLESIAYRTERWITSDELERELTGTKYLVVTSKESTEIHTKPGLNTDWPQGWSIITKKIVIKLGEDVEGEERIFTFHDVKSPEEGAPIRPWVSAAKVETINV